MYSGLIAGAVCYNVTVEVLSLVRSFFVVGGLCCGDSGADWGNKAMTYKAQGINMYFTILGLRANDSGI